MPGPGIERIFGFYTSGLMRAAPSDELFAVGARDEESPAMRVGGGRLPDLPFAPRGKAMLASSLSSAMNRGPEGVVNSRSSIRGDRAASRREPGRLGKGFAVHPGGQSVEQDIEPSDEDLGCRAGQIAVCQNQQRSFLVG